MPDESAAQTIVRLRNEVDELKKQSEAFAAIGPPNANELAHGDEAVELRYTVVTSRDEYNAETYAESRGVFTWNQIFLSVAHALMTSVTEAGMCELLLDMIKDTGQPAVMVQAEDFLRVKIQLRALGLMVKNPSGMQGSWTLTPYGELQLVRNTAIRSNKAPTE